MSNPFINSSFTLRPSLNDRDRPELTLRQTEVSRIAKETVVSGNCNKAGRAFKRQRLFLDRSSFTTLDQGHWSDWNGDAYRGRNDQYISEDEYDTPIIRRRVSSDFPPSRQISPSEGNYWKTRCLGMQNFCDESEARLRDAEEDQRQLRQRIRELEEQLLLQASGSVNSEAISNNKDNAITSGDKDSGSAIGGGNSNGENDNRDVRKAAPPALVIEIRDINQAVSSCFYMTDGEGLNESYDMDLEEDEDTSIDVHCSDMIDEKDDDRNDININQRQG